MARDTSDHNQSRRLRTCQPPRSCFGRIAEVLQGLAPRDREVIELRFGLRDGRPRTLEEVARVIGLTRERVRQLEQRGLDRLREPGRRNRLADFAGAEGCRETRARGPGTPTVSG